MQKRRVRPVILWALGASLILHVLLVPIFPRFAQSVSAAATPLPMSITTLPPLTSLPTPRATVAPTPTPPPATPRPEPSRALRALHAPPSPSARTSAHAPVAIPHTDAIRSGVSGDGSNVSGSGGDGQSPGSGGGPAAIAATAVPAPTPSDTPKPACRVPNAEAAMTSKSELDYPELARQQNITGTANISVEISASGTVLAVAIAKSSGNAALDAAAERSARSSTYLPEIANCEKVGGTYLFVADFETQ